jgi:MFS family permease
VAVVLAAPVAGLLTERAGARLPTTLGMALVAVGLAAAGWVGNPGGGGGLLVVALGIAGIGLGLFVPPNNASVMVAARACDTGMASGLLNMARGLGTAFGVAAGAAAYASGGFTRTCLILAAFAAHGAILAAVAPRRVPRAALPTGRGETRGHLVAPASRVGQHHHELARRELHRGRQHAAGGTANERGPRVPAGVAAAGAGARSASP